MATITIEQNELVGLTSLNFIRPQRIFVKVEGTKPATQLYAFFDSVPVGAFVTPLNGVLGGIIKTDSAGAFSGTFDIPASTFNTGIRVFRLQDDPSLDVAAIAGNTTGSAAAIFTAAGLKQTFQKTVTNITQILITLTNVIADPMPAPAVLGGAALHAIGLGDPLAQTFFTYGVSGGCFITEVDIWFQSKDPALPVTLEIRNVVNGYPGPAIISKWSSVILNPIAVSISNNSSIPTKFTFPRPIYLAEDGDYCFVLLANSNMYNVWTSEFGKKSIETNTTIFEQPYIGSLFKSENNKTWTAEQTEDIKFKIYKAAFNVSTVRDITSRFNAPPILIYGSDFSVTSGSPTVTAKFTFQHGQKNGDNIYLSGIPDTKYRGIPVGSITATAGYAIQNAEADPYSLSFNCGANATSTGTLAAAGIVTIVDVDAGGANYVTPIVTFSGGGATNSGSQATAIVATEGGKIIGVDITYAGDGSYTSTPKLTLTDPGGITGSGAILTPIVETIFGAALNRKFQSVAPIFSVFNPPDTKVTNTLRTSDVGYVAGPHEIHGLNELKSVEKSAVLISQKTETQMSLTSSTQMITRLESSNPNVSPVIDFAENPRAMFMNFIINKESDTIVSNADTELTPSSGKAYARYVSKITTIETVSKGVRIFVAATSVKETSFNVYIRTSLSSNNVPHSAGSWVKLNCDVERNLSTKIGEFKDYLFYMDDIINFDVYDLKIVLYSKTAHHYARIADYRSVILAT